ncbi:BQ5605_C031g10967 [Microbotryum silenes-dioicae]|uniref:BQ5605_C031g10967 protein n=1 Tax=Microbotryum silenes-dioicae TaxID=796604 RepID=A0A2X0N3S4_9BASI|nr:BQ5605_C031g10967 [Microbotryum silenes-dioicae]
MPTAAHLIRERSTPSAIWHRRRGIGCQPRATEILQESGGLISTVITPEDDEDGDEVVVEEEGEDFNM